MLPMPDETSSARSTDSSAAPAPRPASTGADIAASLQAARELGPEYDEAIAAAIVERLNPVIDDRVRQRIDEAGGRPDAADQQAPAKHEWTPRMTMGLLAMCFVIPLSAIGASALGPGGLIMAWVGTIVLYLIAVVGGRR